MSLQKNKGEGKIEGLSEEVSEKPQSSGGGNSGNMPML